MPRWNYYEKDEEIKDAGLKIAKPRVRGHTQKETTYLIEYLCCGDTEVMTHDRIRNRVTCGYTRCAKCGRARRASNLTPGNPGPRKKKKRDRGPDPRNCGRNDELKVPLPTWRIPDLS